MTHLTQKLTGVLSAIGTNKCIFGTRMRRCTEPLFNTRSGTFSKRVSDAFSVSAYLSNTTNTTCATSDTAFWPVWPFGPFRYSKLVTWFFIADFCLNIFFCVICVICVISFTRIEKISMPDTTVTWSRTCSPVTPCCLIFVPGSAWLYVTVTWLINRFLITLWIFKNIDLQSHLSSNTTRAIAAWPLRPAGVDTWWAMALGTYYTALDTVTLIRATSI